MYFEFLLRRAHSRSRVDRKYWSGASLNSRTTCSNSVIVGVTGPIGSGLPQLGFPRRFAMISMFPIFSIQCCSTSSGPIGWIPQNGGWIQRYVPKLPERGALQSESESPPKPTILMSSTIHFKKKAPKNSLIVRLETINKSLQSRDLDGHASKMRALLVGDCREKEERWFGEPHWT